MPLQNRVNPFGEIFRTSARGDLMGNRGPALHDDQQRILRPFRGRRWIACLLRFKGRQREVMTPGLYTELFFLDEAVSFAAGHRPCAECRRTRFNAYREAFQKRCGVKAGFLRADEMDAELHPARVDSRREKVTYEADLEGLPNGCIVRREGEAWLVWGEGLWLWSPEGYVRRETRPAGVWIEVLTPRPSVECFAAGYVPQIHRSASL